MGTEVKSLMEKAEELEAEGVFLGGPKRLFETAGRKLLITLLIEGLRPNSKVLDIGCGCLRGGYWLIRFLDEGCYFGIEPNKKMLDAGIRILLEPGLLESKRPVFDHNSDFDFDFFKTMFDYFVARSIWTHASKAQIQVMLDAFVRASNKDSVFLTSYKKPKNEKGESSRLSWFGRSHESNSPGIVRHSFKWIESECEMRGLIAKEIKDDACNFGHQTWIKITHKAYRAVAS